MCLCRMVGVSLQDGRCVSAGRWVSLQDGGCVSA